MKFLSNAITIGLIALLFACQCSDDETPSNSRVTKSFAGFWSNVDSLTQDVTRILIYTQDSTFVVSMWGKCHPTDCYWGEAYTDLADAIDDSLSLTWVFSFKEEYQKLYLKSSSQLDLFDSCHYTDSSGRVDHSFHSEFQKITF